MKFTSAFLLILILASLAASAASAAMIVNKFTNDFSVNSPYDSQMKACGCENRAEPITITNTGGFYTSYRVDVIADQPWYEAPNQEFTLAPGESRTFTVYAEPPCGTVGIYQYSIRISSSLSGGHAVP